MVSPLKLPMLFSVCLCCFLTAQGNAEELLFNTNAFDQIRSLTNLTFSKGKLTILAGPRQASVRRRYSIGSRSEELSIRMRLGAVQVDYELKSKLGKLTLNTEDGRAIRIERQPSEGTAFLFQQQAKGQVSLTQTSGQDTQTWEASSLWHLLLAHPELHNTSFLPVLDSLQPEWNFRKQMEEVEEFLLTTAKFVDQEEEHAQLEKLIRDLGSESLGVRFQADRALRTKGKQTIGYLLSVDREQLDAEQRFRLRRIVDSVLAGFPEESPVHVAQTLFHDPLIWLSLLRNESQEVRTVARKRLTALLQERISFEVDASPEVRQRQWQALAERLKAN